jgi:hypothetical protein
MPVETSDLVYYLSSSGASEGGARSATPITDNVDENLYEDVSDVSRIAGGTQIRKLFLANEDGVDSYPEHSIWALESPTPATVELGLGVESADDADPDVATLTDLTGTAKIALSSDGPDTRTVTLRGKDAAGDPITEAVVLSGASEVLTVADFGPGFLLAAAGAVDASRTITIKQGAGGTTRGQIAIGAVCCFRWVSGATSKSTGLHLVALVTGSADPIWTRITWAADVVPASTQVKLRAQTL